MGCTPRRAPPEEREQRIAACRVDRWLDLRIVPAWCRQRKTGSKRLSAIPTTSCSPAACGRCAAVRHPGRLQRGLLARSECGLVEIIDQLVEQSVPVDFDLQAQKDRAEPDCGAVHEHEFARRPDPAEPADVTVHA